MPSWQTIYESAYHSPLALWVPSLLLLGVLLARLPFLERYLVGFGLVAMVDPLATGPLMVWLRLERTVWSQLVLVVFVLLGDLRVFMLLERAVAPRRAMWRAFALTLIVPLVTVGLRHLVPRVGASLRVTFLCYELAFVLLAVGLCLLHPRRARAAMSGPASDGASRFARQIWLFVIVQYALWASADVLILARLDAGYALRLLPNLMYYGLYLPFVYWRRDR